MTKVEYASLIFTIIKSSFAIGGAIFIIIYPLYDGYTTAKRVEVNQKDLQAYVYQHDHDLNKDINMLKDNTNKNMNTLAASIDKNIAALTASIDNVRTASMTNKFGERDFDIIKSDEDIMDKNTQRNELTISFLQTAVVKLEVQMAFVLKSLQSLMQKQAVITP